MEKVAYRANPVRPKRLPMPSARHCSRKARGTRAAEKQPCHQRARDGAARRRAGGREDGWTRQAPPGRTARGDGRYPDQAHRPATADGWRGHKPDESHGPRAQRRSAPPARPCQPWRRTAPKPSNPSRKAPEREGAAPEGNLMIVERGGHKRQRCFPHREHGWAVLRHTLTGTPKRLVASS